MNIAIKSLRSDLPKDAKELIETKLEPLEKHLGEHADAALLECEVEESIAAVRAGARYRAEGNLSVNGRMFRAEALSDTLEGAIDEVRDELAREMKKAGGKRRSLVKRGGRMVKGWLRF
jgi:ribosomal subunit interface protein